MSRTRESTLEHLAYGMKHLDGLIWLCRVLIEHERPSDLEIRLNGATVVKKPNLAVLQNPLAESGLIYCRKLLEFAGIKLSSKMPQELVPLSGMRRDDDIGIEDLGLPRVDVDEFLSLHSDGGSEACEACVHTLRLANKGVAHFTKGGERAQAEQLVICAEMVVVLLETRVYDALKIDRPTSKVWTAG